MLEESDGARLDGLLGRAGAGLADLLLVPGQLLVQLLDLLVHRLAPLVYLPKSRIGDQIKMGLGCPAATDRCSLSRIVVAAD